MEDDLRVKSVRLKGRGVFAGRPFAKDELIERAPVIVVPPEEWDLLQETIVSDYCFFWHDGDDDVAVALGRGSLINHSYSPNAMSVKQLRQRVIDFIAIRDIAEGEEITINYLGEPEARGPVGFEVRA